MTEQSPTESFPDVRRLLEARADLSPDKVFLFDERDARRWTYREFDAAVNRAANLLSSRGVGKGDVVSLLLPNGAEYVIAYLACFKLGALAGPVNSLLKPEEIAYVVGNSEARTLLVHSEFRESVEAARGALPLLEELIEFDDESVTAEFDDEPAASWALREISWDDDAIIIYTSGTTGKPKGCLLTHGNLIANARQISGWLKFTAADRLLTVMPLFHMNAVSVTTLSALYA
ncbi:MAG: acyl--CoA ligase, partial [Acidobacteria bacterium]|nr:acyl--CoA ligase [Acidobacteriota bacterium]MCA1642153.1 acyl--CoA ligase [Acidobacteriota bacterium]